MAETRDPQTNDLKDLIEEGKRHRIVIKNENGKTLVELAAIWAVIIALAAPQLAVLVLVGALLNVVTVTFKEVENQR
jgi:hypothetical protein